MSVYKACVLSTLLYGSETWTTYSHQERRLNSFHLRCIRRILNITWRDKVSNSEILTKANVPSIHALLTHRRLRWLGHVARMEDGRIPKDILYGQIPVGSRHVGRPMLRFTDVCKRDLMAAEIEVNTWESAAADRTSWRRRIRAGTIISDSNRFDNWKQKKDKQNERKHLNLSSNYKCRKCNRDCHSRIGLHSHNRRCYDQAL